ncbi:unnamed protein product, partial [Tilletia caries]
PNTPPGPKAPSKHTVFFQPPLSGSGFVAACLRPASIIFCVRGIDFNWTWRGDFCQSIYLVPANLGAVSRSPFGRLLVCVASLLLCHSCDIIVNFNLFQVTMITDAACRRGDAVFAAMSEQQVSLQQFLGIMLCSRTDAANSRVGPWVAGKEGADYGPALLLNSLVSQIKGRACAGAQAQFDDAILKYAADILKVDLLSARTEPFLRRPASSLGSHSSTSSQWKTLLNFYKQRIPNLTMFVNSLLPSKSMRDANETRSTQSEGQDTDSDSDGDVARDEEDLGATRESSGCLEANERTTMLVVSAMLFNHNRKCNYFQSINGMFCSVASAPTLVFNFLNRFGFAISQRSAYRALASVSTRAIQDASAAVRNSEDISTFLMDNINI